MSRPAFVVDTNVLVVANGRSSHADMACINACAHELHHIRQKGRIIIDRQMAVLKEYRQYVDPSGRPGLGDFFFKWVWDNRANTDVCVLINITPSSQDEGDYREFPDDPDLAGFDRSDRKFVSVAIASSLDPTILNAVDKDWWQFHKILKRHGIRVKFLCPQYMAESHR